MRCVEEANLAAGLSADTSPFSGELAAGAHKVAVVVGVPCHRSDSVPSLSYSTRDAVRMAGMLEQSGFTVLRLTSSIDAEQLLDVLSDVEQNIASDGVLLLYFSGHGVLRQVDGRLRRYLVFSDTDLADVDSTALSVLDLQDRIGRIDTADRVVVQDTCFAARPEEGGKSIGIPDPPEGRHKGLALPEGDGSSTAADQRLFASRFFEQALESIDHRGSVYTHHFLAAVADQSLGDLDGDECVGTLEAHTYAARQTAAERGGFQTPQLRADILHNVPLTCSGVATSGVIVAGAWQSSESGVVEPGRHAIAVSDAKTGRTVYRGSVHVAPGEWVAVDDLISARAPYLLAQAGGGIDDIGSGVTAAASAEVWMVGRDGGVGRPAAGIGADWIPQLESEGPACARFRGSRANAGGGWWWSKGAFTAGPTVSAGVVTRSAYDACVGRTFAPFAGVTGGLGAHGHVSIGPAVVTMDADAMALPGTRDGETSIKIRPSAKVGAGVRF